MLCLLLPDVWAAPSEEVDLWVELADPAAHARARAAGFGWAEGQDGRWYRLRGTPAMAEGAGLRWRAPSLSADGWRPDPDEVAERLAALEGPDATLVQIGESVLGEPILAFRLGEGSRALRILGGHHGDEGSSVEVALAVAEAVAAGDIGLPADTELWVVPAVNPDGLAAGTRANYDDVDLNRNYGWEWDPAGYAPGEAPFSEPETRAIRALSRARSFDAGLTLHSGAQNIGWVWNWTTEERPVEEPLLADLAATYADACTAPDFWLTNGADWYVTHGDTTDWSYGAWGAYELTVELTVEKSPPAAEVPTYTAWHLDAIAAWLTRPPDRAAVVRDAVTGDALPSVVTGDGVRDLWSADGNIVRWADTDTAWTVTAPGYASAELSAETRLEPVSLLEVLPEPRLLSRGDGPTVVTVPGAVAAPLRLVQPGETDVTVEPDGAGTWTIDPLLLAPGAWTLVLDEGVIPRGLFVGEVDDRVALDDARAEDGLLTLTGVGFGAGAEAWSIGGPARAPHPLDVEASDEGTLSFVLATDDADVLLWTNGAWLSVVDAAGAAEIDTTAPPEVEPVREEAEIDPTITAVGACQGPEGWGAAAFLPLVGVRRRATGYGPRATGRCRGSRRHLQGRTASPGRDER